MKAAGTLLAIVIAMASLAARPSAEPAVALTVRLYNTAGIAAGELADATREAASILRATGVGVTVRECPRRGAADGLADPCAKTLSPSEVVVRVLEAPAVSATLHADTYGMAYVVRETDRGWLATAFADRVNDAALRAGIQSGPLLGRVIAHEVGHLLLGSEYHSDAGVMRAQWPDELLARGDIAWRFSTAESARMQRVLATDGRSARMTLPLSLHPVPISSAPH